MLKLLGLRSLKLSSREAYIHAHSLRSFNTGVFRPTTSPFAKAQRNILRHFPSKSYRSYTGLASGTRAFAPSYAALLAIVSGMLGYGFARATIASDGKREHTKEISYGTPGEIAFAERELRAALSNDSVSTNKEELSQYGSSDNS